MFELASFYINMTQAKIILKEEPLIEKKSPTDGHIGNPVMYFLDW